MLCTGAIGKIIQLLKDAETNRIVGLGIEFDHAKGTIHEVLQVTAEYMRGPTLYTRCQIPVILSYSVTTHKSQGRYDCVVIFNNCIISYLHATTF